MRCLLLSILLAARAASGLRQTVASHHIPVPFGGKLLHRACPTSLSMTAIEDKWMLWSVASSAAALGVHLENTTAIGRSLSGPVCAMLITATMTNLGILPAGGSPYLMQLQGFVVKLATPLLLLGADMNVIFRETGILLRAFIIGTIGTLLGSTVGYISLLGDASAFSSPDDMWQIASALTAKNIGGGLNFMSVVDALQVSPATVGVGLAIDNVLGLLYFPFVSWLGRNHVGDGDGVVLGRKKGAAVYSGGGEIDVYTVLGAVSIGLLITAAAEQISKLCSFPAITISTFLAVLLATLLPRQLSSVVAAGETVGKVLLLLFFGSIGNSSGTVMSIIASPNALALFKYGLLMYSVHLLVVLGVGGKLLRIPLPDLLVASNANIGNSATASALAESRKWTSRLRPALLVGTFGNAIATFLGVAIGKYFFRHLHL